MYGTNIVFGFLCNDNTKEICVLIENVSKILCFYGF